MQGIYKIENIKTHKKYIGSSKDIDKRFKTHKRDLKNNKHHSHKLQKSWNMTKDKNVFIFEIVEAVKDNTKLFEREQYYIDLYNSFENGYNDSKYANNPKYTMKTLEKIKQEERINKLYNEFINLYKQYFYNIYYNEIHERRLINKYYKASEYRKQIDIIEYFINHYDLDKYYVVIEYSGIIKNKCVTYIHNKENDLYIESFIDCFKEEWMKSEKETIYKLKIKNTLNKSDISILKI